MKHKSAIYRFDQNNLKDKIREALEWINWKDSIYPDTNLWIKPNLTFPEFRPGVTTNPQLLAALLDVLKERTNHLTVFEADGGNNSYAMERAFKSHGLYEICGDRNVRLVNISREPSELVDIPTKEGESLQIPLNSQMLRETDMTISVPVPKMHFVTHYTGAIKNYWGTVPDSMRLKNHYFLKYAINEIMKYLKAGITVVDGTHFLDKNGPVTGAPVEMNLLLAADYPQTADRILMDIMDVNPADVVYMPIAKNRSKGAKSMDEIELNDDIQKYKNHKFSFQRDPVDYLATLGFHSKWITWIVYLSPLKKLMHSFIGLLRGGSRQVEAYYDDVMKK